MECFLAGVILTTLAYGAAMTIAIQHVVRWVRNNPDVVARFIPRRREEIEMHQQEEKQMEGKPAMRAGKGRSTLV